MIKEIKIGDQHIPELIEIYGEGYSADIDNGDGTTTPNPKTKAQWANDNLGRELRASIVRRVQNYRARQAQESIDETDITED
jgi:hypothetical protein